MFAPLLAARWIGLPVKVFFMGDDVVQERHALGDRPGLLGRRRLGAQTNVHTPIMGLIGHPFYGTSESLRTTVVQSDEHRRAAK